MNHKNLVAADTSSNEMQSILNETAHHSSSPKRSRSRAARNPVESRDASRRRSRLTLPMRSSSESRSSLRAEVSSRRLLMRYFWPSDRRLRRRIPVMAANWMKLCLCFLALARSPRDLPGLRAAEGDGELESAIGRGEDGGRRNRGGEAGGDGGDGGRNWLFAAV